MTPHAGPQKEIFPGGTKIDAGPPKLGEVQINKSNKRSSLKFGPIFSPKLGEEQKKRSSLKFGPIFSPKSGEEQKKRSSLKFSPIFLPKVRDAKWAGLKKILVQN